MDLLLEQNQLRHGHCEILPGSNFSDEERNFLIAVDKYKRANKLRFLACSEYLAIAKSLGYRLGECSCQSEEDWDETPSKLPLKDSDAPYAPSANLKTQCTLWTADTASRLKQARENAGLSRGQLAKAVGCHPNYVREVEMGRKRPSLRLASMLIRVVDQSCSEIGLNVAIGG